MELWERLNEAYSAGETAEVIRLVREMAMSVTNGDKEAAEAGTDQVVTALVKLEAIGNFSAWVRVVIKRTASKVWADRRVEDFSLDQIEDEPYRDRMEAALAHRERELAETWTPWAGSSLKDFEDYFPSRDAYRAFCMQADGKSTAEIAAEFGVEPRTMRVRMHRWAKEAAASHRKLLAKCRSIHLAYAAERKSEALKKVCNKFGVVDT